MFSLLTNNKIFDIIGSSKHLNAFVRGNKFRRIGFQRALGRCESVTSAENNSSPEQFRRKRFAVGENGFLPLQRIRVENDAGKRITFRYQKRVVPRVSYNFVSFAEVCLLQKGFFIFPKDRPQHSKEVSRLSPTESDLLCKTPRTS